MESTQAAHSNHRAKGCEARAGIVDQVQETERVGDQTRKLWAPGTVPWPLPNSADRLCLRGNLYKKWAEVPSDGLLRTFRVPSEDLLNTFQLHPCPSGGHPSSLSSTTYFGQFGRNHLVYGPIQSVQTDFH